MYEEKIKLIDSYIKECKKACETRAIDPAESLRDKLVSTYGKDITDIGKDLPSKKEAELENENMIWALNFSPTDYYGAKFQQEVDLNNSKVRKLVFNDLELIVSRLENYRADLMAKEGATKISAPKGIQINNSNVNTNSNTNTNTVDIEISLDMVFKDIDQAVDNGTLTADDAEELKNLLESVEGAKSGKNKNRVRDKVRNVVQFILEKGVDALIAAGPYLINCLRGL